MGSLWKRDGSNVWQTQYYVKDPDSGGLRQIRRTTGQTNRKKALAVAVDMERNAQGVLQAGSDKAQRAKAILAEACAESTARRSRWRQRGNISVSWSSW